MKNNTRIWWGGFRGAVNVAEQTAFTSKGPPKRPVMWHDALLRRPRTIGS
jgi:hypothetical protein